jgi:hypothetical protein
LAAAKRTQLTVLWNEYALEAGNDRQSCGNFLRHVFSGLRGKWAGMGLRGSTKSRSPGGFSVDMGVFED